MKREELLKQIENNLLKLGYWVKEKKGNKIIFSNDIVLDYDYNCIYIIDGL